MNRVLPLLCLAFTAGCFPTYRHTLADVANRPLKSDRGMLVVTTKDGGRITYDAPYSAEATAEGISVTSSLLPRGDYTADEVQQVLTRQYSGRATIFAIALTATAVQLGAAVMAGVLMSNSVNRGVGLKW